MQGQAFVLLKPCTVYYCLLNFRLWCNLNIHMQSRLPLCLSILLYCIFCCVTFAGSEPYCHSILFVSMSVGHSTTYSLPRLIDHNQVWSAGIYLSSDPCKPFWIPISHTFGVRGKNMQNFAYFQQQPFITYSCHCERDASCHMTCNSCLSCN